MDLIDRARHALSSYNDALADHRQRIVMSLCTLGSAVFGAFVLLHLARANLDMAAVNLAVSSLLLWTSRALRRGRRPPLPFPLLAACLVAAVCVSVLRQGTPGLLWAYPTIFICYFVLERRVAILMSSIMVLAVTVCGAFALDQGLAARVFVSMFFVQIMINLVLNVVGDLQQALVAQTITDPLTGAFNRRHMEKQLGQCVVSSGEGGADALLVIDIDHFKRINDTHGHDVGDEVLRKVVTAVSTRKRSSDLLFRMGGEEFVLLLPGASLDQAQKMAEELRLRLAHAELLPGEAVTVSIGVSALRMGQTAEAWIKSADAALYRAKRSGRNRVELADSETAQG